MFAENEMELGFLYKDRNDKENAFLAFNNALKIYKKYGISFMTKKIALEIRNLHGAC